MLPTRTVSSFCLNCLPLFQYMAEQIWRLSTISSDYNSQMIHFKFREDVSIRETFTVELIYCSQPHFNPSYILYLFSKTFTSSLSAEPSTAITNTELQTSRLSAFLKGTYRVERVFSWQVFTVPSTTDSFGLSNTVKYSWISVALLKYLCISFYKV